MFKSKFELNLYLAGSGLQAKDMKPLNEHRGTIPYLEATGKEDVHVNVVVEEDIHRITSVIERMKNSSYNFVVNLVGLNWFELPIFPQVCLQVMENNKLDNDFKLNLVELETEQVRDIKLDRRTVTLVSNPTHTLPPELSPFDHFLEPVYSAENILSRVMGTSRFIESSLSPNSVHIAYVSHFTYVTDERDPHLHNAARRIANDYKILGIRTQLIDGPLNYLQISGNLDYFLRNADEEFPSDNAMVGEDDLLDKLIEGGYIEFSYAEEDNDWCDGRMFYKLTEKGKKYKGVYQSRKCANEGVATGDVLYSTETGKCYEVRDMDLLTGEYLLMCEDFSAVRLNIVNNTTYYFARKEEIKRFKELTK